MKTSCFADAARKAASNGRPTHALPDREIPLTSGNWWKGRESNPRPRHYECRPGAQETLVINHLPRASVARYPHRAELVTQKSRIHKATHGGLTHTKPSPEKPARFKVHSVSEGRARCRTWGGASIQSKPLKRSGVPPSSVLMGTMREMVRCGLRAVTFPNSSNRETTPRTRTGPKSALLKRTMLPSFG